MHNAKCITGRRHLTFEGSEDDVTYKTLLLEEKRAWGHKVWRNYLTTQKRKMAPRIIWTPLRVYWHRQRVNAELSNSLIVSKNVHILGTRFRPLNVGNRRRWLPDGRQIGSFVGRWPCNLVRESWEISKEAKREKNPPENGCQVLDQFCFVHVWFASGWECWDPTTVLHQQKVVLIKHFCSKLDQSIGQWTSLPTQCIPAFAFH